MKRLFSNRRPRSGGGGGSGGTVRADPPDHTGSSEVERRTAFESPPASTSFMMNGSSRHEDEDDNDQNDESYRVSVDAPEHRRLSDSLDGAATTTSMSYSVSLEPPTDSSIIATPQESTSLLQRRPNNPQEQQSVSQLSMESPSQQRRTVTSSPPAQQQPSNHNDRSAAASIGSQQLHVNSGSTAASSGSNASAAAIPDLSNLWHRRQVAEGHKSGGSSRSMIRYPKIKEHEVRVPPTDALLTKCLPYRKQLQQEAAEAAVQMENHDVDDVDVSMSRLPLVPVVDMEDMNVPNTTMNELQTVIVEETESPTPTIPKPGAVGVEGVAPKTKGGTTSGTKPGAVAVAGINHSLPQTPKDDEEEKDDKDEENKGEPNNSEEVDSSTSNQSSSNLPLSVAVAQRRTPSQASAGSDRWNTDTSNNSDWQPSIDSNDSAWGKKPPGRNMPLPVTPPPESAGNNSLTASSHKPKGSLLDDDDDEEDNGSAPISTSPLGSNSTNLPSGENPANNNGPSALPIWGRKSQKATLEEDRMNGFELAFAEGSVAAANALLTSKKPPLSTIADEGEDPVSSVPMSRNKMNEETLGLGPSTIGLSEEEQLETAILESKKQVQHQPEVESSGPVLLEADIEDAKENARSVRSMIASDELDVGFLRTVLELCRADQKKVARGIEDAMNHPREEETDLEVLIDLNINLLDVIEMGERIALEDQKPVPAKKKVSMNLDVEDLVDKKDIFSLICMLRVQQNEKRLDAALALMTFARLAEKQEDAASSDLRDEIRSSGGLHSLLTLFRTPATLYELKVITALAVAYVLPSFVESPTQSPPSLGLKILECLRFLTTAQSVSHNGEVVDRNEMFNACNLALASFWVNFLEPLLKAQQSRSPMSEPLRRTSSQGRQRSRGGDQRQESIALDELLETTVSLIVSVAKQEPMDASQQRTSDSTYKWNYTLVEQVCAIEAARPIAVREGILQLIVSWITSKDIEKIHPAVSALRYVTSIDDKYMAGWIHSEMVNKGAVKCLADLTRDISVTRDVRLYIAQIVSSLCAAPHTRAAIVEANCISFLIGILYEYNDPSSEEIALFAGRAVLQLAAGAISRASAFSSDENEGSGYVPPTKRDALVVDIVESGAISSFVSIAQNSRGALRSIAIEALRVLSEDVSTGRRTRLQMCDDSAALALGTSLKDNVAILGDSLSNGRNEASSEVMAAMKDLQEALCALANILDPAPEADTAGLISSASSTSTFKEPHFLIKGCVDTAQSGGLESLLSIAMLHFDPDTDANKQNVVFLEEACRSLSSIAPLLLTSRVATVGYAKWADDVLCALHHVLKQVGGFGNQYIDLRVIVLQGLGALARAAPLKVRIIDESLPYLLQARAVRNESEVSAAANHVFQSLDLAEDEVAAQVAGNAPDIFAEWFCLQRCLLMQAMARDEIRQVLHDTWNEAFSAIDHGSIELIRQSPGISRSLDGAREGSETEVFAFFADDDDTVLERERLIKQYFNIYGEKHAAGKLSHKKAAGLLAQQTYPVNSADSEARWILDHRKYLLNSRTRSASFLSDHVSNLLSCCFPSVALRDDIVPLQALQSDAAFNFRAFMMAQRRYFSFRREGQILQSLCDKEAASPGSLDAHWTLGFTNSLFAGEFAESLVQVLYKCPIIRGLSFVRNADWKEPEKDEKTNDGDGTEPVVERRGALLANLTGSLPPWISHLTFDGLFEDMDLRTLAFILETMGKLSEGHKEDAAEDGNDVSNSQGKFWFLAIRNSPNLSIDSWLPFVKLLGRTTSAIKGPSKSTLASLRMLDLSGNQLGDELSASVLEIVYDEFSGCHLEHVDLAENCIQSGERVIRVLRMYYNKRLAGMGLTCAENWKSPLRVLNLASNDLNQDKAWLEILTLVQNDGLNLRTLDLSSNNLTLLPDEFEFAEIVVQAVSCNEGLNQLKLSNNLFSSPAIDRMISMLSSNDPVETLLSFDKNRPRLTPDQEAGLQALSLRAKKSLLMQHLAERVASKAFPVASDEIRLEHEARKTKRKSGDFSPLGPAIPESHAVEKSPTPDSSVFKSTDGLGTISTNSITVLFSAPLVFTDGRTLRPFAKLDFDMERELMWQCLKEASRDIELSFDSATHDRLLATMAKRCSCLHYSGHGHQHYLPFEDGSGGPYWFKVDKFKSLIETEGGAPFRFVFVSACYSYLAGETFVSAGVPHVVCCQQESELKDTAALAFTRQFYLALAIGHTVKDSFDQGCKAVRATPNLRDPEAEMKKFLLLPQGGNHDVPIFNAKPVPEWPKRARPANKNANTSRSLSVRSLNARSVVGGARSSELSVRNMMQEDPSPSPPEFFLGREVETYYVLKAVLSKRLVSVIGESGLGRSSLVCALCHYINERATTMIGIDRIYFVRARQSRKRNPFRSLVQRLLNKLEDEEKARPIHPEADMETMFDAICKFLKHEKALVVFDRAELAVQADDANEFPLFLSKLCRETKHVKVLLTNRRDLGIPSLGEHPISLGPLNFANTVRLFANLCPYLHTPADRKKLFETLVKDQEEAEVLVTDPGVVPSTKHVFSILGDGIPARIEKAAYELTKEDFLALYKST